MKQKIKKRLNEVMEDVHAGKNRQKIHLMADIGWISDPNGLAEHNGTVHIFHQYTPDKERKLHKAWGHYTTKDYIHYQDQGTAMVPDQPFDKDGCYSGSALSHDGTLHIFYTGNHLEPGDFDYINEGRGHDTCHMTTKDGIHFSDKEVLLENSDYPENMSCHVRDPKLSWIDGRLYMVLGARTKDSRGCALLYKCDPDHPEKMKFKQVIDSSSPMGYMWECPALIELDGHCLLLTCPQGVEKEGFDFENLHDNGIFEIEKSEDGTWRANHFKILDHGTDFYAPQTFEDDKGREILIAWMGMPDHPFETPETEEGWIHCLTLPRQLLWKDGQVYQFPVEELEEMREKEIPVSLKADETINLPSRVFELRLNMNNQPFTMKIRHDAILDWDGKVLTFSMKESGQKRTDRHVKINEIHSLEIFSDESSLEIFINQGQEAFTTRIYDQNLPLSLTCSTALNGTLYLLKAIEVDYSKALAEV